MVGTETDYDVIIIGGGATGLAAALYSSRAMLKTLIVEQLACGGQILLTDIIENYPGFPDGISGPDLAQLYERQASKAVTSRPACSAYPLSFSGWRAR